MRRKRGSVGSAVNSFAMTGGRLLPEANPNYCIEGELWQGLDSFGSNSHWQNGPSVVLTRFSLLIVEAVFHDSKPYPILTKCHRNCLNAKLFHQPSSLIEI